MFNRSVEDFLGPIIDEYVLQDVSRKLRPTAMANRATRNTEYVAMCDAGKNSMQPTMYSVRPMRIESL